MNEKSKAILSHMRKYTLTMEQIEQFSDLEWDIHLKESKDSMQDIENEFRQTK